MNINATEVKKHRSQFGWTQQLLADACGVSLRTIQRVERYGAASMETLMSLCSVFEIDQQELIVEDEPFNDSRGNKRSLHPIAIVAISIFLGIIVGANMMYLFMR